MLPAISAAQLVTTARAPALDAAVAPALDALDPAAELTRVAVTVDADGTGDYTTPEAALAAVGAAGGGIVHVRAGTYLTDGLTVQSNTVLRGEGAATVIRSRNAARSNTIQSATGASNVLITDLVVDGNRANNPLGAFSTISINGPRNIVRGCWVTGSPGYGIVTYGQYAASGNHVVISGNVVYDCAKEGIEIQATSGATINGNAVIATGYNAILVWANSAQSGTSSVVTITGNYVDGYGLLIAASGIRIDDGASDITVTGNVVRGGGFAGGTAISVSSTTSATVKRCIVSSNVVHCGGVATTGISVTSTCADALVTGNLVHAPTNGIMAGSAGMVVQGNIVKDATGSGIYVTATDVTVGDNRVSKCTSSGVTAASASTGTAISGNTIRECGLGISLPGSQATCAANAVASCGGGGIWVTGAGCSVTGNTLTANGGTTNPGITVAGADTAVTGNRVTASGNAGIAVVAGGSGVVSGNTTSANRGSGILLGNTRNVAVNGNVSTNNGVSGNQPYGIFVTQWSAGTTSGVIVSGNRCTDTRESGKTQTHGIRVSGTVTDTHLGPNLTSGNATAGQLVASTSTVTTLGP